MANEIDDALKTLSDGLTWADAIKSHGDEAISLWRVSGRVDANDELTTADRRRLADAIVKKQQTKESDTMTSTTDENMFDDVNRPFLLAAQKHRAKLQRSSDEDLFSIARRLRTQVETARAADAAQRRPSEATTIDASGHRPGWRTDARLKKEEEGEDEINSWEHDRRKKQSTTHVRSDDPTKSEEALSDARRKKQYYNAAGQEEGSSVEEEPERDDARDARSEYIDRLENSWKTCGR